jgi:hypothetical protein
MDMKAPSGFTGSRNVSYGLTKKLRSNYISGNVCCYSVENILSSRLLTISAFYYTVIGTRGSVVG